MNIHANKTSKSKSSPVTQQVSHSKKETSGYQFKDNRPEGRAQSKLQEMANNSIQVKQLKALHEMANNSPQATHQRPIQKKENDTGLPDTLKSGIEDLSGYAMDDVKVHYNSPKPAQLQAHAFAQGSNIHLATGQEKHLPHEAWHVVQQKQGRVKPTMQMKGSVAANDETGLEKEADVMGQKATTGSQAIQRVAVQKQLISGKSLGSSRVVQRFATVSLMDNKPNLTPEESIEKMDSGELVTLARGVSPSQKKYLSKDIIRGSFIGHTKMLTTDKNTSAQEASAPDKELTTEYVNQNKNDRVAKLIEFSSDYKKAQSFSKEARLGYTYVIQIKRKYLSKGSTGEKGWIAHQSAPYVIVYAERRDSIKKDDGHKQIGAEDVTTALTEEQEAELMLDHQENKEKFMQRSKEEQKEIIRITIKHSKQTREEVEENKKL